MTNEPLIEELERLKEDLLRMGRLLEVQVYKAVQALVNKDPELAREVIENDDIIDEMELNIEKRALNLIALKQPLARDLRLIATALRMIVDIERMADHAEEIARLALELHAQTYIKPLIDIPRMARVAQQMVDNSLKSFIEQDTSMAMALIEAEREMDALYDQIFRELLSYMMQDQKNIPQATSLLLVAGHLERIGDHATNLGEMVIYVVDGKRLDLNRMDRDV